MGFETTNYGTTGGNQRYVISEEVSWFMESMLAEYNYRLWLISHCQQKTVSGAVRTSRPFTSSPSLIATAIAWPAAVCFSVVILQWYRCEGIDIPSAVVKLVVNAVCSWSYRCEKWKSVQNRWFRQNVGWNYSTVDESRQAHDSDIQRIYTAGLRRLANTALQRCRSRSLCWSCHQSTWMSVAVKWQC